MMLYNDHAPPHFHAEYGEYKMSVEIKTGRVIAGKFPRRAGRFVEEWRRLNVAALQEDWQRAVSREPLNKIQPLE